MITPLRLLPRSTILLRPTRLYSSSSSSSSSPSSSSSSSSSTPNSAFQSGPSPPRLPASQQAEFERLQRAVADRIADPTPLPHEVQPTTTPATNSSRHSTTTTAAAAAAAAAAQTTGTGGAAGANKREEIPNGVRKGAKPEFEGDTNPKTGEVGGPKNEPLRWGSGGDWSYNGRVTDF